MSQKRKVYRVAGAGSYFKFARRKKGTSQVSSAEKNLAWCRVLEAALYRHQDLLEVAVVELPGGLGLVAFVSSTNPRLTGENLNDFLSKTCRLSPYICPDHYSFVPELPKTPSGKVQRQLLAAEYAGMFRWNLAEL